MIHVENLTKIYGEKKAVDDISFDVHKGEIVGFLGPNGAGKTTTMRIVTGFLSSNGGTAKVGGFDVFENPIEVKRLIGYLPEHPPLYRDMSVRSYLHFAARLKGVEPKQEKERVAYVLGRCGLTEVADRLIGNLSKGYKQRVGLAQALIHDPEVLILDEPTLGLDPKQIIEIRNLIKELGEKRTVILSTHILPEVTMTCKRVIIINEGRIVATDSLHDLQLRLKKAQVLYLKVRKSDGIRDKISKIKGVASVAEIEGDEPLFRVEAEPDCDVREETARTAVEAGAGLLELKTEEMSLEDIFLKLTTEEGENP